MEGVGRERRELIEDVSRDVVSEVVKESTRKNRIKRLIRVRKTLLRTMSLSLSLLLGVGGVANAPGEAPGGLRSDHPVIIGEKHGIVFTAVNIGLDVVGGEGGCGSDSGYGSYTIT
jgi:hypothetical protein